MSLTPSEIRALADRNAPGLATWCNATLTSGVTSAPTPPAPRYLRSMPTAATVKKTDRNNPAQAGFSLRAIH